MWLRGAAAHGASDSRFRRDDAGVAVCHCQFRVLRYRCFFVRSSLGCCSSYSLLDTDCGVQSHCIVNQSSPVAHAPPGPPSAVAAEAAPGGAADAPAAAPAAAPARPVGHATRGSAVMTPGLLSVIYRPREWREGGREEPGKEWRLGGRGLEQSLREPFPVSSLAICPNHHRDRRDVL